MRAVLTQSNCCWQGMEELAMACYSLPWRGQSECGCVRTAPSWCAVMEKLPAIGLIQGHLKLFYFVVSEWGWLRESALWCLAKAHPRSLPHTSASLCFCFALLQQELKSLFSSLCLSWNEPAGVISISQVFFFSKIQIEIMFV